MRGVMVFAGSSHPVLAQAVCERLGTTPSKCQLRKFSNGETSVEINVSVRNQDVYVLQSGSSKINDSIMELLIMINACKGGSARSITAVLPYFPYSRQSKQKSHRGSITAKMLANLLTIAGVDHIITVDLHATQMQGFFSMPVDNLFAEPLIARWISLHVPNWKEAVVVSKNAGGSKRVTSLADSLKLSFGIITTDRRRLYSPYKHTSNSTLFFHSLRVDEATVYRQPHLPVPEVVMTQPPETVGEEVENENQKENKKPTDDPASNVDQEDDTDAFVEDRLSAAYRNQHAERAARRPSERYQFADVRAGDVITGRLVDGQLVDDDYPSPTSSNSGLSEGLEEGVNSLDLNGNSPGSTRLDPMSSSVASAHDQYGHANHASYDTANASSDDEEDQIHGKVPERTITLVGDVKDTTVLLVDDMIDTAKAWIAAAETAVKRGGAKKVYCIATHGIFGDNCLDKMQACKSIDHVVVTNTFPLSPGITEKYSKLIILDISALLAENIRRHHNGESVSDALF